MAFIKLFLVAIIAYLHIWDLFKGFQPMPMNVWKFKGGWNSPEEVHSLECLVDVRQLGGEAELAGLPGDVAVGVVLEVVVQGPGHAHPRAGLHPHPAPRRGHQRGQQPAPGPAVGRGHHNLELWSTLSCNVRWY